MMKTVIPITAIWLRGCGPNKIEVLVEINDQWFSAIEGHHIDTSTGEAIPISYITEGNGRINWKEDELTKGK